MTGIVRIEGRACPLGLDNVDTDQLCAARFMKRRRFEGYGDALLHSYRHGEDGAPVPNPIDAHAGAPILIAGRNFGGGSSREAAVYALVDAGFRVVIAASFGDIFAANASRNGLVPAAVAEAALPALLASSSGPMTVDLERLVITHAAGEVPFTLDETRRTMLMNGWDDADFTAQHREAIEAFVRRDKVERPWAQGLGERGPHIFRPSRGHRDRLWIS